MDAGANKAALEERIRSFSVTDYAAERTLSLFSASIAVADPQIITDAISLYRRNCPSRSPLYELVLQSYLFLGFPRMLEAADLLHQAWPEPVDHHTNDEPVSPEETRSWYIRGDKLCRRVYDKNYTALRRRVESFAPDVFRWMILEGYGKVLSRPALDIVSRECAIVACLVVENRPRQLHSHIRGALNVGADRELVRLVIEDLRDVHADGWAAACDILKKLEMDVRS